MVSVYQNWYFAKYTVYQLWYPYTKTGISHVPLMVFVYQNWYFTYTKTGITYVPKMVFIPILVLTLLARYAFCVYKLQILLGDTPKTPRIPKVVFCPIISSNLMQ